MNTSCAGSCDRLEGMVWGAFIADALAMPAHWYYDRAALRADYGELSHFRAPREPHPDSILWRSKYDSPGKAWDILGPRAQWWGKRGVHYHRELEPGENTLNLVLARHLGNWLRRRGSYDLEAWLREWTAFMLAPDSHRDTYIEEYHREFFRAVGSGREPKKAGGSDPHIGGLASVPGICHALPRPEAVDTVRRHVGFTHAGEVTRAAEAFARMLFDVAGGKDLRMAIVEYVEPWADREKLSQWSERDDLEVVGKELSPACYIREAFPAALFFAWKYAGRFREGVIANAMAGGDNCHRGVVVGALLGGEAGLAKLPQEWVCGLRMPPLPPPFGQAGPPGIPLRDK